MSTEPARGWLAGMLYGSAFIYASVTFWHYPKWTVDDAYIVFRYAKHLVEHGQPVWNVGSKPVEGYTGIALLLLVAGGMKIGMAPECATRIVGIGSFFIAAWTLRENQRRLGVPEPARAYVTATTMVFSPLIAHATSGLETCLFVATLSASFGTLLSCDRSPHGSNQAWLWSELLLLSLIRPEGVLFAGAFGCALAIRVRRGPPRRLVSAAVALGLFVIPYGAYFAWRARYYGRLLPNTFYAKALPGGFGAGFVTTTAGLLDVCMPPLAAALAIAILTRRPRLPRLPVSAALVAVAVLAVGYSRSTLIMGYFFRFQVHALFVLLPLLGALIAGAGHVDEIPRRYGAGNGLAVIVLVGAFLLVWPIELIRGAPSTRAYAQRYLDIESEQPARVGAWLRDHLPPSESIACWIDAGVIPFVADDHVVIDFGRLNDAYLARPGITRDEMASYFFAKRPGALVLTSNSPTHLEPQHDGAVITDDPRFADYEARGIYCSPEYPEAPCEVLLLRRGVHTL